MISRQELEERAVLYRENSLCESTRRSRASQWKRYIEVCELYGWTPMPVSVEQACLYVTYLAVHLKFSTIVTYYQAVVFYHVCAGVEPVRLSDPILKATLKGIEKGQLVGSKGKDAMFPVHLSAIGKVVNFKSDLETLVFVAILLMFRSLLRVSHIVMSKHTLRVDDIKFEKECVLLSVNSSKTDQARKGELIPINQSKNPELCAVRALKFLCGQFKMPPGSQLFSCASVPRLTYSMFAKCFKTLTVRAGLEGDFASHSLRRGGATFMSMLNCPIAQIKARGMWKSDCVFRYIVPDMDAKKNLDRLVAKNC